MSRLRVSIITFGILISIAGPLLLWPNPAAANPLTGVDAVTSGRNGGHTCALTAAGGVKCWGGNTIGGLGDGTTTRRTTPVDVLSLATGVAAVAAGRGQTCALTTTGGVKCWGWNEFGQLGAPTTEVCGIFDKPCSTTPVDVTGLNGSVAAVATGSTHTCAVMMNGRAKC